MFRVLDTQTLFYNENICKTSLHIQMKKLTSHEMLTLKGSIIDLTSRKGYIKTLDNVFPNI